MPQSTSFSHPDHKMETPYATRQWVRRNPWFKMTLEAATGADETTPAEAAPDVAEAEAMDNNNHSRPSCSSIPYVTRGWVLRNPWFKKIMAVNTTEPEAAESALAEAAPEVEMSDPHLKIEQKLVQKDLLIHFIGYSNLA